MEILFPEAPCPAKLESDSVVAVRLKAVCKGFDSIRQRITDFRISAVQLAETGEILRDSAQVKALSTEVSPTPPHDHKIIEDRPIAWRADPGTNDTNTFILEFRLPAIGPDENTLSKRPLLFDLAICFTSFITVSYRIEAIWDASAGTLAHKPPIHLGLGTRVVTNFFALLGFAALTGAWNWFLNKDIHTQSSALSQHAFSVALGAVLSFLLLSLLEVRHLLSNARNLLSVIGLPELHLDRSTYRVLSWKYSYLLIGGGLLGALAVIVWLWSVPLPSLDNNVLAVYDSKINQFVIAERVYLRHVSAGRFRVICAEGGALPKRVVLATLSCGSGLDSVLRPFHDLRLEEETFELNFPAYMNRNVSKRDDSDLFRMSVSGMELLKLRLSRGQDGLRARVCGQEGRDRRSFVRYRSQVRPATFELRARPVAEYDDLKDSTLVYRNEILGEENFPDLYGRRSEFVGDFREALETNEGVLSRAGVVKLAGELLSGVRQRVRNLVDPRESLEVAILLRGLFEEFAARRDQSLLEEDIEELLTIFTEKFESVTLRDNDYRILRSQWESLLTLEKKFPGATGSKVHEAIIRPEQGRAPLSWIETQGPETVLQYLRASVGMDVFLLRERELPDRRLFFRKALKTVSRLSDAREQVQRILVDARLEPEEKERLERFIVASIFEQTSDEIADGQPQTEESSTEAETG